MKLLCLVLTLNMGALLPLLCCPSLLVMRFESNPFLSAALSPLLEKLAVGAGHLSLASPDLPSALGSGRHEWTIINGLSGFFLHLANRQR